MSWRQSLVLACFGFLTGATLASASLNNVAEVAEGERWSCGDHFWGLSLEIVDAEERIGQVDFFGDAWNARGDIAPADIELHESADEVVFVIKDELGGRVRLQLASPIGEDTLFRGVAQETSAAGEVTLGLCTKQ